MQRGSINHIIFDDEQPSVKDHPSRTATSTTQPSVKSHHLQIIEQQITYLTDKIKTLQQQADSLVNLKSQNSSICRQSSTSIDIGSNHGQEIVMTVERKIQIVVRQTKKIVQKLGQTFERKLHTTLSKKYQESGVGKIKEQYHSSLKNIEQNYKKELDKISNHQKEVEKKMAMRVNKIEEKMTQRMKQYETKEKEYVDWIHHLQRQLQEKQKQHEQKLKQRINEELQQQEKKLIEKQTKDNQIRQKQNRENQMKEQQALQKKRQQRLKQERLEQQQLERQKSKSKRRIQMTHVRKEYTENSSIMTGDNFESITSKQLSSQVNDSKIQRRHKIFDPVSGNTSSSVSPQPQNRNISPINSLSIASSTTPSNVSSSKIINPLTKSKPQDLQRESKRDRDQSEKLEKPTLVIEKATQPLKNNFTSEQQLSPWRQMDSIEKSPNQVTKRNNNMVKDVNSDEFYKDVPKPHIGWQRFQDFQENSQSESGSEEDIIFYRNEDKSSPENWPPQREQKWPPVDKVSELQSSKRQSTYEPGPQQRVFSPFDLN